MMAITVSDLRQIIVRLVSDNVSEKVSDFPPSGKLVIAQCLMLYSKASLRYLSGALLYRP